MQPNDFLQFLSKTQRLKSTLRHSWTDNINRQESAAEHSWHMSLMAIALEPYLENKVDLSRVLKLVSVHDTGERPGLGKIFQGGAVDDGHIRLDY